MFNLIGNIVLIGIPEMLYVASFVCIVLGIARLDKVFYIALLNTMVIYSLRVASNYSLKYLWFIEILTIPLAIYTICKYKNIRNLISLTVVALLSIIVLELVFVCPVALEKGYTLKYLNSHILEAVKLSIPCRITQVFILIIVKLLKERRKNNV